MNQVEKVVTQYITSHFTDAQLEIKYSPENNGYLCNMQSKEGISYQFTVFGDALSGDEQIMFNQLERYSLASVLVDLEGMHVSVTDSGCIVN